DDFFNSVGLRGATDEQKAKLTEQLTQIVQNRMAAKLVQVLTVEELEHFDNLLEEQGDDPAYDYLLGIFPDYPDLLNEEVVRVKAALSQDVAAVGQVVEDMLASSQQAG
ncbi:MAG TPA: DUF5663 domain-containing protein, partial [Candidatus Polarisedimenticolaceae bacterium]|nr:DUF5663 domain-containing protein [Candidatus Polarisedimenticolaceae bacterium]